MRMLVITATLLLALTTGCGSQTAAPPASTVNVSSAAPSTVAAGPITLPDLTNQNADIARKKLTKLGLTDVTLASANPKYTMVIVAANWTVVSMEPPPGTVVQSDDPVVLKVTKD